MIGSLDCANKFYLIANVCKVYKPITITKRLFQYQILYLFFQIIGNNLHEPRKPTEDFGICACGIYFCFVKYKLSADGILRPYKTCFNIRSNRGSKYSAQISTDIFRIVFNFVIQFFWQKPGRINLR